MEVKGKINDILLKKRVNPETEFHRNPALN